MRALGASNLLACRVDGEYEDEDNDEEHCGVRAEKQKLRTVVQGEKTVHTH